LDGVLKMVFGQKSFVSSNHSLMDSIASSTATTSDLRLRRE
jgi:hypothetical protein